MREHLAFCHLVSRAPWFNARFNRIVCWLELDQAWSSVLLLGVIEHGFSIPAAKTTIRDVGRPRLLLLDRITDGWKRLAQN